MALEGLIAVAVLILVLAVVLYIIKLVVTYFRAPEIIVQIAGIIFALIIVTRLLQWAGVKF